MPLRSAERSAHVKKPVNALGDGVAVFDITEKCSVNRKFTALHNLKSALRPGQKQGLVARAEFGSAIDFDARRPRAAGRLHHHVPRLRLAENAHIAARLEPGVSVDAADKGDITVAGAVDRDDRMIAAGPRAAYVVADDDRKRA